DWNILVGGRDADSEGDGDGGGDQGDEGTADGSPRRVVGFIDFGDMVQGAKVVELAVAIAYGVMGSDDPLAAATEIVAGFHETFPLADDELALLFALVQGRLARSVLNSAVQHPIAPDDPYLKISEAPAWDLLERLAEVHP